jgi:hypothetical protein
MALIFRMPTNVPMEVSESYQRQNTLMYAVMADHLSLSLTNLDNSSVPKVQAGSVFGVNGGLFYVPDGADEAISGSPATGQNYVYAVPNDGGATFQYSAVKPVWSATKGGWYNGNNRAVAAFNYASGQYTQKTILGNLGTGEYDTVRISGENIEFWQGTVKVAQIQIAALGLVMSGLATFNDGFLCQGDINALKGSDTVKLVFNANGTVGWAKV